jgi:hypothetical protein
MGREFYKKPICKFEKLEAIFCKHYWKVQMNEQMYMALQVIKEGGNILWTYTKTKELPSASNKWQFVNHFLSSMTIVIFSDNHNGDEGHLVWTQGSYDHLWKKYWRRQWTP